MSTTYHGETRLLKRLAVTHGAGQVELRIMLGDCILQEIVLSSHAASRLADDLSERVFDLEGDNG